ncbi:hypothetical protein [Staphylococcus auricularis]|uniref:NERD domain-containing protein n=1 Tax=Staphylococcus auricularis TaxID=29379 RepID=A0AAW7MC60_9STAP|nr:hypothetical protein [Staphylococcus auricularis]MDC6326993.1 hypothetical protein [Staphylococcus auricularis]MDN4532870.1 hypothetical protein [Staphylococcus auricularis]HJE01883.1 hypothetical protein [Staphylococcus auricularis]
MIDSSLIVVIGAIIVAIVFLVLWIVTLISKNNTKQKIEESYSSKQKQLNEDYEDALEKERIENKKAVTKQKEEYETTVANKDKEIDALKLFTKNHSEYITDMKLIEIRDRLVNEKRIRPEDMHIMANIFLPGNEYGDVRRVSHLVLTRTGLYIIDSNLLKGHVLNGVSANQFKEQPLLEQVFSTLDLNSQQPQTIALDQNDEDQHKLTFVDYTKQLAEVEALAGDMQTELNLKYTPTTILYFNPKREGAVSIANYAQSSSSKVLVGPEQLDEFFNKFVFHGRIQYSVDDLQRIVDEIESFN